VFEDPISNAASQPEHSEASLLPRVDRRAVEMRAYAVRFDNSIVDLRVVDLSYDGCAVETNERLISGELLKLSVLGRGFVRATVRWYKDRKAGLLFEPERHEHVHKERIAERLEIAAKVGLRRSASLSFPVRIFDLTRFGCKCEFVDRPQVREPVWVRFPGLDLLQAEVCWVANSNVGLRFANTIHPAVFELLLKRLQP
jgi:hypothetical protein